MGTKDNARWSFWMKRDPRNIGKMPSPTNKREPAEAQLPRAR